MKLSFKSIDITPESSEKEINKQLENLNIQMYFLMDIGPNQKRLWIAEREDNSITVPNIKINPKIPEVN